jgi:hypothetical protein
VNIAPLLVGAGIKGKIADGWASGTPVVTTAIGAEGMMHQQRFRVADEHPAHALARASDIAWGGIVCESESQFADAAVMLATDAERWHAAQHASFQLLGSLFNKNTNQLLLQSKLDRSLRELHVARESRDIVQNVLWQQQHRASEYFGRWIAEKQRNKSN